MARYDNPFAGSPYPTPPGFAALGSTLATALFGDPQARAEQEYQRARTEAALSQARSEDMRGGLYKQQGERQRIENEAVNSLPDLIARLAGPPPASPALPAPPPANAIVVPQGFDGVARAIAESLPGEGVPSPSLVPAPPPMIDATNGRVIPAPGTGGGLRFPDRTIGELRAGLPGLIGALVRGNVSSPDELIGSIMALYGDDEAARRGMVGRGTNPADDFALTPERADDIRQQGFDASMAEVERRARTTERGQDVASRDRRYATDTASGDRRYATDSRGATPVANAGAVAEQLFPGIHVNEVRRDPNSRLGRANPNSWHNRSGAAVDVRPVQGMTFEEYVQRYRDSGYQIIEAIDEVNHPSGHATGPHWHVVLGERTGRGGPRGSSRATGSTAARQPRAVSGANVRAIDAELERRLGSYFTDPSPRRRNLVNAMRRRASAIFQRTGNPVEAANAAVEEMLARGRGGSSPRTAQSSAPASPRRIRYDANGNRISS